MEGLHFDDVTKHWEPTRRFRNAIIWRNSSTVLVVSPDESLLAKVLPDEYTIMAGDTLVARRVGGYRPFNDVEEAFKLTSGGYARRVSDPPRFWRIADYCHTGCVSGMTFKDAVEHLQWTKSPLIKDSWRPLGVYIRGSHDEA